ncbi:MAG: endonuclease III [Catonella sp.]|uniref:endonuclease III n=1 Tax=Catonella sp. TaxID=2382125 RepID=UPI003FA01023
MKKLSKKEKERIDEIIRRLIEKYGGESRTYLEHENAWQLLFATILSAQCTDARVNIVTRELFKKYKTLEDFAGADLREMEKDIHSTGFYHNKAKNIIACARMLLSEYGGEVPEELEKLIVLPGVGRKTANVVRGNIFDIPSIVVDTHVKRISKRLGITTTEDPVKAEFELMEVLPESAWIIWNLDVIALGREICTSRSPKCERCFLADICPSSK